VEWQGPFEGLCLFLPKQLSLKGEWLLDRLRWNTKLRWCCIGNPF